VIIIHGLNNIAHELFHLMTWDEEILKSVEKNSRLHIKNERLANAFAAGLLVPKEKLQTELMRICAEGNVGIPEVVALAEQFQVSQDAMLYRLLNARLITEAQLKEMQACIPHLFLPKKCRQAISRVLKSKYVRLVYLAYEHMKISRAKAAKLLNVDLSELSDFFNEYGFVEVNAI
jgi:XRE family transcriptional regulator, fatty acid utilization regulator